MGIFKDKDGNFISDGNKRVEINISSSVYDDLRAIGSVLNNYGHDDGFSKAIEIIVTDYVKRGLDKVLIKCVQDVQTNEEIFVCTNCGKQYEKEPDQCFCGMDDTLNVVKTKNETL